MVEAGEMESRPVPDMGYASAVSDQSAVTG